MHQELLPHLCCPTCHHPLQLSDPQYSTYGEIMQGTLGCQGCARRYPIRAGIADFLPAPRPPTLAQVTNEIPFTAWAYERIWRPRRVASLSIWHVLMACMRAIWRRPCQAERALLLALIMRCPCL
jgi:uncharacterized protein YbaR (Trm112 family)